MLKVVAEKLGVCNREGCNKVVSSTFFFTKIHSLGYLVCADISLALSCCISLPAT